MFPYPVPVGTCLRSVGEAGLPPLLPHRTHHTRPAPRTPLGTAAADGLHAQTHGHRRVCGGRPGARSRTGFAMRIAPAHRIRAPAGRREVRGPPAHQVTRDSGLSGAMRPGPSRPAVPPGRPEPPAPPAARGRTGMAGGGRGLGSPGPTRSDEPGWPAAVRGAQEVLYNEPLWFASPRPVRSSSERRSRHGPDLTPARSEPRARSGSTRPRRSGGAHAAHAGAGHRPVQETGLALLHRLRGGPRRHLGRRHLLHSSSTAR